MGYNDQQPSSAPDPLIGRERIRGASRMIAEGTEAEKVSADQINQVAADVEAFRRAHKFPVKKIASAIGYSPSVLSEFLAGKYAGNSADVAIHLDGWLSEEEQRAARPETTQFVWTNVAQTIKSVASYCRDHRSIGMVFGPETSGMGKTTTLRAIYRNDGPRLSTFITIDKVDANPTGLLKKILHDMHHDDSGTNKQRFDRIVDKLKGRSHILLIDQVHNLRYSKEDKPFYILTDIHEATQTTAQLWCGTSDLVAYLDRQRVRNVDESLAQIRRRIFPCIDLIETLGADGTGGDPLVTVDQVKEMFARNKLKLTSAAARFICRLCNSPDSGSVGLCVRLVEYATMLGGMQRPAATSIDVPLLQEAMRRAMKSLRADKLLRDIGEEPPMQKAKVG